MACVTSAVMGVGSIITGIFTNMPFICSPSAAICIWYASFLQIKGLGYVSGCQATVVQGVLMMVLFWKPLGKMIIGSIPVCIQVGTSLGIGNLTALAGAKAINLVQKGTYTIVTMGPYDNDMYIALFGTFIIAMLLHYHVKPAFVVVLIFNSIVTWLYHDSFPKVVAYSPTAPFVNIFTYTYHYTTSIVMCSLCFLSIVSLNGLGRAFSDLAKLTREDNSVPRIRFMYLICGALSVFSGFFGGPPIVISPETGAGIKAGARTGLSAVLAGLIYCVAAFFAPLMVAIPSNAYAPLLLAIGVILFLNTKKIDWTNPLVAFPCFAVQFIVPFTYSILNGVFIGWILYLMLNFVSFNMYNHGKYLLGINWPAGVDIVFTNFLDPIVYPAYDKLMLYCPFLNVDSVHAPVGPTKYNNLPPTASGADLTVRMDSADGDIEMEKVEARKATLVHAGEDDGAHEDAHMNSTGTIF